MMPLLRQLSSRLASSLVRGVVTLVDDSTKMQMLHVGLRAHETRKDIERFQQYGFTSHPLEDAEVIALGLGGNREHTVIIAVDDRRYRLKGLAKGEVALYDDQGQSVVVKRAGLEITGLDITIQEKNAGQGKITLNAKDIEFNAEALVSNTQTTELNASTSLALAGAGGPAVARVGDSVDNGVITSGSTKVRAT